MSVTTIGNVRTALILIFSTCMTGSSLASIEPLAGWDLIPAPGNQEFHPGLAMHPNVQSSNMVRGPGLVTAPAGSSFNSTWWNGDESEDYVEFGFTVDAGYQVDLSALLLSTYSSFSGPANLQLFASTDGFTSPLHTFVQPSNTSVSSNIDLSSLPTITGAFSVRIYEFGNTTADGTGITASAGSFRISNYLNHTDNFVRFEGEITEVTTTGNPSVPEAQSLLVWGFLALCAAVGMRLRR